MLAVVSVVGILSTPRNLGFISPNYISERQEASEADSLESEMMNSKCRAEGGGQSVADELGRSLFRQSFMVMKKNTNLFADPIRYESFFIGD